MRQAQKYVSGLCNKIYVNNQKVAEKYTHLNIRKDLE